MAFWNQSSAAPKRNYRFKVLIQGMNGGSVIWWAKGFKTPSYEVSETAHDYLDNKYYFPGRLTWNDSSMTLVDPISPINAVEETNQIIIGSGYKVKNENEYETISRPASHGALGSVVVDIIDAEGNSVEQWTLKNAFIKSVAFSDLAYDNDELRTIDITFRYDWATCSSDGGSTEQFSNGV
jgi:hypothetical protein